MKFVIMDGFLLYYDEEAANLLDMRILIRSEKAKLKQRRLERNDRVSRRYCCCNMKLKPRCR